jgi:hypothetical protein
MTRTLETSSHDDLSEAVNEFDYGASAGMFMTRKRIARRSPITYRRFATAAEAVRFVVEELPAPLHVHVVMEVLEQRYDHQAIRELYDGNNCPLVRLSHARMAATIIG